MPEPVSVTRTFSEESLIDMVTENHATNDRIATITAIVVMMVRCPRECSSGDG